MKLFKKLKDIKDELDLQSEKLDLELEDALDLKLQASTISVYDLRSILRFLTPDEKMEAVVPANIKVFGSKKVRFVLTNKRVLIIKNSLVLTSMRNFKAIEYPNISSISLEVDSTFSVQGKLVLKVSNSDIEIKVFRAHMQKLYDVITEHVNGIQQESDSIKYTSIDIADQIKKLADLKEQGILTEEEFTAQKQKILNM
jgi:hypothetical protein